MLLLFVVRTGRSMTLVLLSLPHGLASASTRRPHQVPKMTEVWTVAADDELTVCACGNPVSA